MNKVKLSIAVIGALIMAIGVGSLLSRRWLDKKDVKSMTYQMVVDNKVGLVVRRDAALNSVPNSADDEKAGQLWEFTQPLQAQQEFVVSASYEQGASLKKLTSVTKQSLRDAVMDNVNRQLPKQYPEYHQISQQDTTINGIQATRVVFEYTSTQIKVKQQLLLLFKNGDTVAYMKAQARAEDYDSLSQHYFEPIFSSAKFQ
ncbi:MAG TPA: hypothetical protein VK694_07270 [Verrucomicrobiae bacterium]|nr:hypothetical protein [Verrucomicrobiae bacterium]